MAVDDDLRRLADLDTVYLSRTFFGTGAYPADWYRGRFRQAANGEWVFNAYTGAEGVVGFELGVANTSTWQVNESPAGGLIISAPFGSPAFQTITLYSQMPSMFAS
jgi:hypothetical protein